MKSTSEQYINFFIISKPIIMLLYKIYTSFTSSHCSGRIIVIFFLNFLINSIATLKNISYIALCLAVLLTVYSTFFAQPEFLDKSYLFLYLTLGIWIICCFILFMVNLIPFITSKISNK